MSKESPKNQLKLELFKDSLNKEKSKSNSDFIIDNDQTTKGASIDKQNQPHESEEPDYHMGYWVEKHQREEAEKEQERQKRGENKQEIPQEIWEEINIINKNIQKRMMHLSNSSSIYEVNSYKGMIKAAENLKRKNNNIDANELMRLLGALNRINHCRRLLKDGNLKGFSRYIKDLPMAKGSSGMIILRLAQYDAILKVLEKMENS